ncbi:hypothetical protein BGZ97_013243 [Linnemannia gamsii]|uniref:Elongation factor 3 n=1 Tax=Linnemannia gamsii TaxID=64522 RepID=A0A9P6R3L1_9FUNG|nr:hypothetical protein BGZ97_013243 [Linnemannia gamsii]
MISSEVPAGAASAQDVNELTEMLGQLYTAPTSEECDAIARDMANKILKDGLINLKTHNILTNLQTESTNKKSGLAREGALIGICALAEEIKEPSVPFLLPMLPTILDLYADKGPVVQDAAARAAEAIMALMPSQAAPIILPILFQNITGMGKKWQTKVGALQLLADLSNASPIQVGIALPEIIPIVKDCLSDTKKEVAEQAGKTMLRICNVGGNPDITRHLKDLCDCMAHPEKVPAVMEKLSATTFVADMHGPALAIMVPLLVRALNERSAHVQRQTTIIVDNLCKLVKDPAEAGQFLPNLLPGLERIIDVAAAPEILHVASLTVVLIKEENLSPREWNQILTPYFTAFLSPSDASAAVKVVLDHYIDLDRKLNGEGSVEDNEDGEELCNIDFSLAYGGMMLLNHTKLKLHRGHRYGLCGPNGAGKSTLMRAISLGKLDGFPSPDVVRTVFVEHALQGEQGEMSVAEFVASDAKLASASEEEIAKALTSVGFSNEMQKSKVASLSGGWKMKLELARAMLMNADILLLDEPTNHMDVTNIKWLEDYLISQTNVTSIIVSHDSSFLDNVCTNILHYERKKLKMYKGNLSEFVKLKPEAKSYYTLAATSVKFEFPKPSFLVGVKSNTKAIMKLAHCTYTYPGNSKPSLHDVSVQLSLSSRVGVIGPNGAGKSTMIKLLTGEASPQEGTAWRHPNLRIGYVAHHLEQHLEKTPNAYIQWRYQGGADREVLEKPTVAMSEEEEKQMETWVTGGDGSKRQVEAIMGRQKLKKSYQYEIKWKNHVHKFNTWMSRERLLELGYEKLVRQFDDKEASREGLGYRELTPSSIRRHLEDVGLDGDIADHNMISGLSGGQKVVIAAAMWNNPHMLVLDEPTNYLDREALGGLAVAIRHWGGAVIMISHNKEFLGALCPETWSVSAGRITIKGKTAVEEGNFEEAEKPIVVVNKKKKKSRNEIKAQEIRRRLRHLEWLASDKGTPKPPDTDSD